MAKRGGSSTLAKRTGTFRHGDLRRALLEGAHRLLECEGPLGVGLRAAARLAGVSQTAPYRHFADKESMLAALAERGFEELFERMLAAARGAAGSPAALAAIAEAYVSFAAERPQLFRLMFGPEVEDRARHPRLGEAGRRGFDLLTGAISEAQREGAVRAGDPRPIALFHWCCVHGVASLLVDGRLSERSTVGALVPGGERGAVQLVLDELRRGMAPR